MSVNSLIFRNNSGEEELLEEKRRGREGGEIWKWRKWGIKGGGSVIRGTSVSGVMGLALLSHVLMRRCYRRNCAKLRLTLYAIFKRWSVKLCSESNPPLFGKTLSNLWRWNILDIYSGRIGHSQVTSMHSKSSLRLKGWWNIWGGGGVKYFDQQDGVFLNESHIAEHVFSFLWKCHSLTLSH